MKRLLVLCAFLGTTFSLFAQTLTITEQGSNEPLKYVNLYSENPNIYATTNVNGQADISAFKNTELIYIRLIGYKTRTTNYSLLSENNFNVSLEPSSVNLDELVVSGTRWLQSSGDVPSRIQTIIPQQISLENPQTAADLLNVSGQVFIQKSQQGGGSPMIRGFATNRLLYSVDGVRMNTAIFRGGNIQNVISLDPYAIEKTEILFGPGSVLYGSDAIGGVMSFKTLTPQLSLTDTLLATGKATTRYSTANNEKTAHFDINLGWKKWGSVTSISTNNYDDLRMGSHGPKEYIKPYYIQRQNGSDIVVTSNDPLVQRPSGYSQINMMQKIRFKPNSNWDLKYGFHYSETSEYGRYDRHNRMRNGLPRYAEWKYGPQKWLMNNLSIENAGNTKLYDQLNIQVAMQAFEESRIDRSLNSDSRSIRVEEVDAYSFNLDLIKSTNTKNKLFYGFEYVLNDVTSTGIDEDISTGLKMEGPSRYPQSTWQSIAVYLNDQYKFSDKFLVQSGIRYNQIILDATFDTNFYPFPFTKANLNNGSVTGSLGFVSHPQSDLTVSGNIATAFRAPNVDDVGKVFDSEPGSVVIPNPDLKPEYAYNADIGVAKIFSEMFKVDATGYYTILDNALVRRDFMLNGQDSIIYDGTLSQVQAIQNAATARVYGVQLGIEGKLASGLGFSSKLNIQNGEEELDNGSTSSSRHAAPWFGVTRLTYDATDLDIELYANYQGEKSYDDLSVEEQGKTEIYASNENGEPYSPSWYTINFKANYQLSEVFSVQAGLENITDQRYRPYSSGLSGPGRNYILSVTADF
jgi:hemoglobin/transferrin/lactoferrin receptor protein